MPTLRDMITKIGFQVDEAGAKAAESRTQKMARKMKLSLGTIAVGIGAIGWKAIEAAGDMEMLTTQFEVMLGSTEKANAMMEELKEFAAGTPFALEDLSKGTQQLLSFGVAENDVIDAMRMLGDTAGGNAEKLNGLVLAYGKVQAKGKASMEEINMLTERGLPIITTLREQLGVTEDQFFKLVSAGKISRDAITQAFRTMTSEGGMFFRGMEKQSLTFQGLVSTMKDNIKLLLAAIGEALLPIMKEIVTTITQLVRGPLGKLIKSLVSSLAPILQIIADLLNPVTEALLPLADIIKAIIPTITSLLKVIKVLEPILNLIGRIFAMIADVLGKITPALNKLIELSIELVSTFAEMISLELLKLLEPMGEIFTELAVILADILELMMPIVRLFAKFQALKFAAQLKLAIIPLRVMAFLFSKILKVVQVLVQVLRAMFLPIFEGIERFYDFLIDKIMSGIERLIGWVNKIPGINIDLPGAPEGGGASPLNDFLGRETPTFNPAVTAAGRTTNIDMKNDITLTVPEGTNTEGVKKAVQEAARAVFTVELQKILVDTGN